MPPPERPRLSACIITFNEEGFIAACIRSVGWCDEIVVVDSHSTDRTREIATEMGARVIERDWPGFVEQKQFATDTAGYDWILQLDADERISPALREEIERLRSAGFPGAVCWRMPRLSWYLGAWIRHGSWYPDRVGRLFDRRHGRWGGYEPHARVETSGPVGRLRNDLLHYPYSSLSDHLQRIDRYTNDMARSLRERGRRARVADLVLRPWFRFLRFYILKRGFLDGWRGLLLASLEVHYTRIKYAKMLEMQRRDEQSDST
jgi:glycosyltransferase involved in cell wall biosynthesis